MFDSKIYIDRRKKLCAAMQNKGIAIIFGNSESPMNYEDNIYPFRQDSNFLYFAGIQQPNLILLINLNTGDATLCGDDLTLDHIVWMGAQPSIMEQAQAAGIKKNKTYKEGLDEIAKAHSSDETIHYLPPYRFDRLLLLQGTLQKSENDIKKSVSIGLCKAIIALRSRKSEEEIKELEKAVNITKSMHLAAMRSAKEGQLESHIAGIVEGIAIGGGGRLSYPCIATINGHILHNHYHGNLLKNGDLLLLDAGASAPSMYAGDITRTFPIANTFSVQQKEIYEIVLKAQEECIKALKPGVTFKSIHLLAATIITNGLKDLGLMQGNTAEAVEKGAHTLFFPHGLGHMIGLDVHDMEDLGEDLVGYNDKISRSDQFGLKSLRLGILLEKGFVVTVEPGIYFIPILIEQWKKENKHTAYICYDKLNEYLDFGGIRIEDNVLITNNGYRILGNPIPKSVFDIEALRKS